jgi:hypothetical protein
MNAPLEIPIVRSRYSTADNDDASHSLQTLGSNIGPLDRPKQMTDLLASIVTGFRV